MKEIIDLKVSTRQLPVEIQLLLHNLAKKKEKIDWKRSGLRLNMFVSRNKRRQTVKLEGIKINIKKKILEEMWGAPPHEKDEIYFSNLTYGEKLLLIIFLRNDKNLTNFCINWHKCKIVLSVKKDVKKEKEK
jgi:hypothetical protein